MKKFLVVIAILSALCLVFCACGKTDESKDNTTVDSSVSEENNESSAPDGGYAGLANPVVEYTSLEEINKIVGVNLVHPAAMGVSDESFCVINGDIAQYKFTIAGREYTFRAADEDKKGDISGVYIDGSPAFENETADYSIKSDAEYYAGRFLVDDVQYVICVADDGSFSEADFDSILLENRNIIISEVSDEGYTSLLGSYQDKTSMRATAEVKPSDKNEVSIDVNWSSSADSNDRWLILAEMKGNKLTYDADDIFHYQTRDGSDPVLVNDSKEGYFEFVNSELRWTGSNSEATNGCVFVMA